MTVSEEEYQDKHAAMLGRVTLAWNDCHSAVFTIFHCLSGMSWEGAQAVFFSLRADRAQRDMTLALMRQVLGSDNDRLMYEFGKKLLGRLDGLADERNAATHTMWAVMMPERKVTPHPTMPRPPRLQDDFRAQFSKLANDLGQLFGDLLQFDSALRGSPGKHQSARGLAFTCNGVSVWTRMCRKLAT